MPGKKVERETNSEKRKKEGGSLPLQGARRKGRRNLNTKKEKKFSDDNKEGRGSHGGKKGGKLFLNTGSGKSKNLSQTHVWKEKRGKGLLLRGGGEEWKNGELKRGKEGGLLCGKRVTL